LVLAMRPQHGRSSTVRFKFMRIDYVHAKGLHTIVGPQVALPVLFSSQKPFSLLDVGCGTGTWLKAALDFGIAEVFGVDGVIVPPDQLHVPLSLVQHQDLTRPWNLNKQFDAVLCMEVAEHLDSAFAPTLIDALVRHGKTIYFSAACPGQAGQHHVNCQWPEYWQRLFNERNFVCDDGLRWQLWDQSKVEPWYRQNLMVARHDAAMAGQEPRIKGVLHPEMLSCLCESLESHIELVENGHLEPLWYLKTPLLAFYKKLKRHVP
jgi:SAM-dependent methyltransferase